jgi:hypothetical protein
MAASAQGIRAGRAFVELFADDTKLVRGLRAAERKLKAFGAGVQTIGKTMLGLGSAAVAPILGAVAAYNEAGSQLDDMSQRTGMSVEALSELGYAAQLSGANLETLEGGIRKMQKFLASATEGSAGATESLAALGLTFADLQGLSPDQQFELLADRVSKIADPALRTAAAMEIFGKTGTALLPMMQNGAKGIAAFRQEARDLGIVMSTEDARSAAVFGDALDQLWAVLKSGVYAIGGALAPMLTDLVQSTSRVITTIVKWIRENRTLIVTVFKIAAGVAAAGTALFGLGGLIAGVGAAFGVVATIITAIGSALATLGTIVVALLSPIGLVTVAVAGLGGYLLNVSDAGSAALTWLAETFQSLKDEALAAWKGIGDALAAGDLALAAKILWTTLRMEWQKGVAFLEEHWIRFKEFFVSLAADAFYGTVSLMVDAWAGMQVAWVETTAFMADAWTIFTGSLTKGWSTAQNFISKGVLKLMKLFDSELDVEGASQILDEDLQKRNTAVDQQMNEQIGASDQQRQQRRSQIEADRQGAQAEVNQAAEAERQAREQQNAEDLQASSDALSAARREWEAAVAEAAAQQRDPNTPEIPDRLRKAHDNLAGMEENLVQVREQRLSTTGTFNAAAVRGLGGGSAEERTARATEATAQSIKKIEERSRLGQPTFS